MSSGFSSILNVTDTLVPVCTSICGSSGGLAGAQRSSVLARLWVLLTGITLNWLKACATHTSKALNKSIRESGKEAKSRPS